MTSPRHWHAHAHQTPPTGSYTPDATEPLDLEALALAAGSEYEDTCRSARWRRSYSSCDSDYSTSAPAYTSGGGSGLPLVCSNCGVSFFSLQITDDELECYCSGECKWSVVMYREMDRRMHALRRHLRAAAVAAAAASSTTATTNSTSPARASKTKSFAASSASSSRNSAATIDTESCESYPRYMDDVIACR